MDIQTEVVVVDGCDGVKTNGSNGGPFPPRTPSRTHKKTQNTIKNTPSRTHTKIQNTITMIPRSGGRGHKWCLGFVCSLRSTIWVLLLSFASKSFVCLCWVERKLWGKALRVDRSPGFRLSFEGKLLSNQKASLSFPNQPNPTSSSGFSNNERERERERERESRFREKCFFFFC